MEQVTLDDILSHHGVKGQRWGIRRYQPYPSGTKGGKEIGEAAKVKQRPISKSANIRNKLKKTISSAKKNLENSRNKRETKKNEKIAKEQAKEKERKERDLESVINSGDANLVNQRKNEMTSDQLRRAIDRVNLNQRIGELSKQDKISAEKKFDDIIRIGKKVNDFASLGINAYRTAKTIQGITKNDKTTLDRIMTSGYNVSGGGGGSNKNKKKR